MVPMHSPIDEVASGVTQRYSTTETPTHGESVGTAQTNIDTMHKIDASAREHLRAPRSDEPYAMNVVWDDGPHNIESFIRKAPYRVRIFVGVSSNDMLTVVSLVDTGQREFGK